MARLVASDLKRVPSVNAPPLYGCESEEDAKDSLTLAAVGVSRMTASLAGPGRCYGTRISQPTMGCSWNAWMSMPAVFPWPPKDDGMPRVSYGALRNARKLTDSSMRGRIVKAILNARAKDEEAAGHIERDWPRLYNAINAVSISLMPCAN